MHSLSKTTPIYVMLMIPLLFAAPLSAQDKVRVGLSSVSATNGSIWVAEDKGLFRKHGIDVEVIVVTPAMVENCRSRMEATDAAMVSGLAPGSWAVTWMVGNSTRGTAATGSCL